MNKGLDLIQRQQIEEIDGCPTGNVYIGLTFEELAELEKELKDYSEIKEIAKRYHWDDFVKDTHMVDTDEKYLRLFNAAIPNIQADYRKARAFDIIKSHIVSNSCDTSGIYFEKNGDLYEVKLRGGCGCLFLEDEFRPLNEVLK